MQVLLSRTERVVRNGRILTVAAHSVAVGSSALSPGWSCLPCTGYSGCMHLGGLGDLSQQDHFAARGVANSDSRLVSLRARCNATIWKYLLASLHSCGVDLCSPRYGRFRGAHCSWIPTRVGIRIAAENLGRPDRAGHPNFRVNYSPPCFIHSPRGLFQSCLDPVEGIACDQPSLRTWEGKMKTLPRSNRMGSCRIRTIAAAVQNNIRGEHPSRWAGSRSKRVEPPPPRLSGRRQTWHSSARQSSHKGGAKFAESTYRM